MIRSPHKTSTAVCHTQPEIMPSNSNPNAQRMQNWPNHVRFIKSQAYHSSVPPSVRQHIQGSSSLSRTSPRRDLKVIVRRINQPGHPAFGQFGLFAGQKISPKCHIIYYIGATQGTVPSRIETYISQVKFIAMIVQIRTTTYLSVGCQTALTSVLTPTPWAIRLVLLTITEVLRVNRMLFSWRDAHRLENYA